MFEDRDNGYPIGQYNNRQNVIWDIDTVEPDKVAFALKQLLSDYALSNKMLVFLL